MDLEKDLKSSTRILETVFDAEGDKVFKGSPIIAQNFNEVEY
ncbi:hypothetical protein [Polaribacter sp. IC073]|nr:hypothetical protein [Polaribacter sp. IC073]